MSTYTDLHNNIKETINVDYRTRATNQQVKLLNEQNEYWGTFKGQMEVEGNSVISGAQLNDVVINNAVLCGDIDFGGLGIPVDKIKSTLKQLSDDYQSADEVLRIDITQNKDDIVKLREQIENVKSSATGDTSKLKDELTNTIATTSSFLSTEHKNLLSNLELSVANLINDISVEISARISCDDELNKKISKNANTETSHYNELTAEDSKLYDLALSVDRTSKERDEEILKAFDKNNNAIDERFSNAHGVMLSTVSNERHYAIIGTEVVTREYPFLLTDYAVNNISTTVNQSVLICNGCNVGSVVKNDKEITINFFKTLPLNTVEDAVYAGTQYTFKSGEFVTIRNGYKAWYGGGDTIEFTHDDDPFFIIEHNNAYVGKLRHAKYTEDGAFISGEIDIDSDDTAYAPFKNFNGQTISTTKSFLSAETETFQLNDDYQSLTLKKGIITSHYTAVNANDAEGNAYEFARIFKSAVTRDDADNLLELSVTMPDGNEVRLAKQSNMSADFIDSDGKKKRLAYLSTESKLMQCEVNEHFSYELSSTSSDTVKNYAKIVIDTANAEFGFDYAGRITYTVVNTEIEELNQISVVCEHDSSQNIWTGISPSGTDINLNVSIFPGTKKVSVTGNAYGVPFNVVYDIVIDSKHVDNDNPLINYITTLPFNIGNDGFNQKIERGTKYNCTIRKNTAPVQSFPNRTCTIQSTGNDHVKIAIPQREYIGDKVTSREMIVNMIIDSVADDVKVVFSNESKENLSVMFDSEIVTDEYNIKANRQNIFKLREYENNKFLLEQLDNADLRDTISSIQNDVDKNASDINSITSEIDVINEKLSYTLQYRGIINADESITTFAHLISSSYDSDKWRGDDVKAEVVYPGYFWIIRSLSDNLSIEGIKVGNNDRVYIKETSVFVSAITSANVDVEDVYDSDTVHESQLYETSVALSIYTTNVSNALCEASCILSADDRYLSSQISSKVELTTFTNISNDLKLSINTISSLAEKDLSGGLSTVSGYVEELKKISADADEHISEIERHYNKTFSKDIVIKHHISDEVADKILSVDRLTLINESQFEKDATELKYDLAFKYGTLVLVKKED